MTRTAADMERGSLLLLKRAAKLDRLSYAAARDGRTEWSDRAGYLSARALALGAALAMRANPERPRWTLWQGLALLEQIARERAAAAAEGGR